MIITVLVSIINIIDIFRPMNWQEATVRKDRSSSANHWNPLEESKKDCVPIINEQLPDCPLIDLGDAPKIRSKPKNPFNSEYHDYLNMLQNLDFTGPQKIQTNQQTTRTLYFTANTS